jgi:putative drug exporter of the RND superfamily
MANASGAHHLSQHRPDAASPEATWLGRLAGWCYDRRRRVLTVWVVAFIGTLAVGAFVVTGVFNNKFSGGTSDSHSAQTFLQARFPTRAGDPADVVFHTSGPVTEPATRAGVDAVLSQVRALPHVTSVRGPFDPGVFGQISRDGRTAYGQVQFDTTTDNLSKSAVQKVVDTARAHARPGFDVELGGAPISKAETPPAGSSEAIGILAAIVILLVAFGSLIAMGLPIMTALLGLGVSVGIIDLFSRGLTVPTFGTQLAAMVGIGVGIDYALFIVTAYRGRLHVGDEPRVATVRALATSGRAVLFAGCTVVISLLGMMLLGASFIYGLAFSAITAVIIVMTAALTLLPAVLGFVGQTIDRLHLPLLLHRGAEEERPTLWYRWSRVIQRHPITTGSVAVVILVVLAIPLFSMHLAFTDQGNDATTLTTRRAYDQLAAGFGPGVNGPLVLAADVPSPAGRQTVQAVAARLRSTPGVAAVAPPNFNARGDAAVTIVLPTTSPQDQKTQDLVNTIRDQVVPAVTGSSGVRTYVGGVTAAGIDTSNQFSRRLPWVVGGVVLLSFLLLMAVFRSLAVPIKAAVMNLLSIGAAYGVIVAVFQWGWLGGFFGIGNTGPIDPWIPLMLFTILFGLSMDYEVFLLTRIRDEWRRTGDNATAVADGLASTGRVITAAAAIMVCVFGSFVLGDLRILKVFGLGLAVAVFVDATVVRSVLVPATMELLGKANWWFPARLDRIVPRLSVEVAHDGLLPAPTDSDERRQRVGVGAAPGGAAD